MPEIVLAGGKLSSAARGCLEREGYCLRELSSGTELLVDPLETADAVLVGERFSQMGGLELVSRLHKAFPRLPIVMLAKSGTSEVLIEAIKRGAYDCLTEPVEEGELLGVLDEALEASRRMHRPVKIGESTGGEDMLVGNSRKMRQVYKELGRLSATPVTVLIQGETGTGKELIARALYQHGHRAHQPFIAVNCAAIPDNLIESELFGHEKGAFTGATTTRIGKFEQAHNATLFLDEIGDLDLSLQAKLLRVLQERQIQRVGGRDLIPVDVRLIAATHRDLAKMIAEGIFREDLFYRLNVASIEIPPLRERDGDVPLLVDYFVARYGQEMGVEAPSITAEAVAFLEERPWPGNVRQLQNVLRKAQLSSRDFGIDVKTLVPLLEDQVGQTRARDADELGALMNRLLSEAEQGEIEAAYPAAIQLVERVLLSAAIQRSAGNQAKAARWLGMTRYTLREKLNQYGLHPRQSGEK